MRPGIAFVDDVGLRRRAVVAPSIVYGALSGAPALAYVGVLGQQRRPVTVKRTAARRSCARRTRAGRSSPFALTTAA